jgi:uncharacterized protein (DUF433 family)
MATLHIHDVSDQIARAYLNVPKEQQQRLKRILEETISLCTEASRFLATPTQESTLEYENKTIIRHTKGVCGGHACIRNTRLPVWTLVSLRSQGATDNELLEEYPSLIQTDLEAAWIYYQHHQDEIDQAIALQDDED